MAKTMVTTEKKGVDYNIENIENKENEENIQEMTNGSLRSSLGVVAYATPKPELDHLSSGQGKPEAVSSLDNLQPTPLRQDEITRARVQFYDNGDTAIQRYKLKCTIDLVDGSSVEFIASLTKDMRNFKKYIPEQSKEEILTIAQAYRKKIKQQYQTYPYLGKFHLNQGQGRHRHSQVEPNTIAIVWFNTQDRTWSGALMIYDWVYEFDLFEEYVTARQRQSGLKSQDIWKNPLHDKTERPLTWAEQRLLKK